MINRVIISGFGGQGVMLTGNILGESAFEQGIKSTILPTYGVEQRGGTANTTVVISDKRIFALEAENPDTVIALNEPSVNKYLKLIKKGGCLIVNSSQYEGNIDREDIVVIKVPADEKAIEIGSIKVSNIIMMGVYAGYTKMISYDSLKKTMNKKLSKKQEFAELNSKALDYGYSIGNSKNK